MKFLKIIVKNGCYIFDFFQKLTIFSILNIVTFALTDKRKLYVCELPFRVISYSIAR